MKYNLEDVLTNGQESVIGGVGPEVRLPCEMGDDCTHASAHECDMHRQRLMEEEHRKKCSMGAFCNHFSANRGMPPNTAVTHESPADFMLRSRGLK